MDIHFAGESIRLNESYDWGGGKYAGSVVRITAVQDEREVFDDEDSLIYVAEFVNDRGEVCDTNIPVLPKDIDETYDDYEVKRAAWWNTTARLITGQQP